MITDILLDIAYEKNGYAIGEPWRFSEFSLVAVIPIVRRVELPRGYKLLSEAKDGVLIKDTGNISQMEFENRTELPVLLKGGEILAGATQERALTVSQILMAGEKVLANVVCVHSTKGIRAGQRVVSDGYAPTPVRKAAYTIHHGEGANVQHRVWESVRTYSAMAQSASLDYMKTLQTQNIRNVEMNREALGRISTTWTTPSENLYGRLHESQEKFKEAIKKVPKVEHQVGVCLVSFGGFDSLEAFNHPDSWQALREQVLKAEAANIADVSNKDNLFEYKPEKARAVLKELLSSTFKENEAIKKEHASTLLVESDKLQGEVVVLYEQPIHLTLLRKS